MLSRKKIFAGTILILMVGLTGCAVAPRMIVPRPWYRILDSEEKVLINSKFRVDLKGETEFLLGSEELLLKDLTSMIENLLIRRGYKKDDNDFDYRISFEYKTSTMSKLITSSLSFDEYYFPTISALGMRITNNYAQNVYIASAINYSAFYSQKIQSYRTSEEIYHIHVISVEIFNNNEELIWKGESFWESKKVDIRNGIHMATQLILSNLPRDNEHKMRAPAVKSSHLENYYKIYCYNDWFSCPALPFRILFMDFSSSITTNTIKYNVLNPIDNVLNPTAMAAYIDLIQNAEFALPVGSYKDPFDSNLWSKALIGDKYYIGDDNELKNILIELRGAPSGYRIHKCWIASEKEYSEFMNKFEKWQDFLKEYFNVFSD